MLLPWPHMIVCSLLSFTVINRNGEKYALTLDFSIQWLCDKEVMLIV
jgi:hypothetical protein